VNMARRISSRAFLDRLNTLRHQRPDFNTLIFLAGEDVWLEWGHSVGVTVDETLRSLVDPLPPLKLKHIAGPSSDSLYLASGLRDAAKVVDIYEAHAGAPTTPISVLDFGCGAGRMMRFISKMPNYRLTGCDVNGDLAKWCAQNLVGIDTVLSGMTPPLPFADGDFDMVYSKSVFSHLPESSFCAWIAELARVVKPGGWIALTTNGVASLDTLIALKDRQAAWQVSESTAKDLKARFDSIQFWHTRLPPEIAGPAKVELDYGHTFVHGSYLERIGKHVGLTVVKVHSGYMTGKQDLVMLARH